MLKQTMTISGLCFLVSYFFTPVAQAQTDIALRINNTIVSDAGFYAVSENNILLQAQISVGHKIHSFKKTDLWAEAAYAFGSTDTTTFDGALNTKALFQTISVGGRLSYPVMTWLHPYLRVGLGLGISSLKFKTIEEATQSNLTTYFDGQLVGGVEVLLPTRALRAGLHGVTGGLLLEVGYGFSTPIEFTMAPEEKSDQKELPLQPGSLGDFTLSGAKFLLGAVLQF